jgi:Fur family transcriptional regulator, zinc uptake regulator
MVARRPSRETGAFIMTKTSRTLHAHALSARALSARLSEAAAHCEARGAQLTDLRREVLSLLLQRGGPVKAYDLQDDMRARHGKVAPTTVYRALDFLIEHELAHRIDALNAFIACQSDHGEDAHHALMVVCERCERATELHDDEAYAWVATRLTHAGIGFAQTRIEIKGLCQACMTAP